MEPLPPLKLMVQSQLGAGVGLTALKARNIWINLGITTVSRCVCTATPSCNCAISFKSGKGIASWINFDITIVDGWMVFTVCFTPSCNCAINPKGGKGGKRWGNLNITIALGCTFFATPIWITPSCDCTICFKSCKSTTSWINLGITPTSGWVYTSIIWATPSRDWAIGILGWQCKRTYWQWLYQDLFKYFWLCRP
jgi:hypothetical protein